MGDGLVADVAVAHFREVVYGGDAGIFQVLVLDELQVGRFDRFVVFTVEEKRGAVAGVDDESSTLVLRKNVLVEFVLLVGGEREKLAQFGSGIFVRNAKAIVVVADRVVHEGKIICTKVDAGKN